MPEANSSPSLKRVALGDLDHELKTTRSVLEKLPEQHFGWKPHPKSWSLGELAAHVANLLGWLQMTVETDGYDMASASARGPAPASRAELLRLFDDNLAAARAALDEADDAALMEKWTLRHGERQIFSRPKVAVLRSFGLSHMIHHRAQLSVYLRLLDEPVPSVYGPSADERGRS